MSPPTYILTLTPFIITIEPSPWVPLPFGPDVTSNIYLNIILAGIRISPSLSEIERQLRLA